MGRNGLPTNLPAPHVGVTPSDVHGRRLLGGNDTLWRANDTRGGGQRHACGKPPSRARAARAMIASRRCRAAVGASPGRRASARRTPFCLAAGRRGEVARGSTSRPGGGPRGCLSARRFAPAAGISRDLRATREEVSARRASTLGNGHSPGACAAASLCLRLSALRRRWRERHANQGINRLNAGNRRAAAPDDAPARSMKGRPA